MLDISNQHPDLVGFKKALRSKKYAPNTQRLYLWQAKNFLIALRENKVKATELQDAARRYLLRKRRLSRSNFLQACATVEMVLEVKNHPLPEDVMRKLQSA